MILFGQDDRMDQSSELPSRQRTLAHHDRFPILSIVSSCLGLFFVDTPSRVHARFPS